MPDTNNIRPQPSVLIIDDDVAVLALLRRLLSPHYRVYTATDGREAVDACLAAPRIDVMIVDVMLGGEIGPDVAERCRKHQSGAKVIYMSGYSDEALRTHGVDAAAPFLHKPFHPRVLLEAIRTSLPAALSEKTTVAVTIANDGEHFHVSLDGEPQSSHRSQRDAEEAASKLLHAIIPTAPDVAFPPIPSGGIFEQPIETR